MTKYTSKYNFIVPCILILCTALFLSCAKDNDDDNDKPDPIDSNFFPAWQEGYLDIHAINTGRGESTFFILPDGTTMLVDAGHTPTNPPTSIPKPNDSRSPGEWIARYINHMIKDFPVKRVNYSVITHFHWDHMGTYATTLPLSSGGNFRLSGITEVHEHIPFDKLLDRNWPDYNYPEPLDFNGRMNNYNTFLSWHIQNRNATVEQFVAGRNDQIVLVNNPGAYPDFEIRNIAVNGNVWTGEGSEAESHFPDLEFLLEHEASYITTGGFENNASIAFRVSYGNFDYFTGGDLSFRGAHTGRTQDQWKNIELPVAMVTGQVDAMKANHHAAWDANSSQFLNSLRPRAIVIHTCRNDQPSPEGVSRLTSTQTYPGPRDVFATNVLPEARIALGADASLLTSQQGHVVIRVDPSGDTYMIYIINDSDERFVVKEKHGPYNTN
jgi:beta-lactamase superfamily II metal-dependent hydrolase